ncbi:hypothetical protein N7495_002647 [Penicillium taxi]|uniref:uncharacterized protein n=1 Tax=Penicillium taxi TaxID=168475 RepID=UPI00254528F4|nr:uncharacterized protein N7495_002647 [Penicillium taxi]KAJ5902119.1 hypothetical protein N7495_002647 [Penicillium taxi]
MSLCKTAALILGSAALVAGHGYVTGAVVDGTYYTGYLINEFPYETSPPEVIAWSEDETDLGYIDGTGYSSANIICHKDAKAAALEAPVKAGGSVELQWSTWPSSHHGPVITYLANCNGNCSSVDKTTLEFFKIDEGGLINDDTVPGEWASDKLIANNNSYTVTIPSSIESGSYVLRHEIIALHSAENKDGAQNYPQCIDLEVTGGGDDKPTGTLGTELYKDTDPGILVNIYSSLSTYSIPGPALYTGAVSASGSTTSPASVVASPTTVPSIVALRSSTSLDSITYISTSTVITSTPSATSNSGGATNVVKSSSTTASPTASGSSQVASSDYVASDWSTYLSSLSADDILSLLHQTFKWIVTEKKHARDIMS